MIEHIVDEETDLILIQWVLLDAWSEKFTLYRPLVWEILQENTFWDRIEHPVLIGTHFIVSVGNAQSGVIVDDSY